MLFVYGTLKRGCINHIYLTGGEYLGRAYAPGYTLYVLFVPYAVRAPPSCRVYGELYRVPSRVLEEIDELEIPAGYARVRAKVASLRGGEAEAWIYAVPGEETSNCLADRYRCPSPDMDLTNSSYFA